MAIKTFCDICEREISQSGETYLKCNAISIVEAFPSYIPVRVPDVPTQMIVCAYCWERIDHLIKEDNEKEKDCRENVQKLMNGVQKENE